MTNYKSDEDVRLHVRIFVKRAMLLRKIIDNGWLSTQCTSPGGDELYGFYDYLVARKPLLGIAEVHSVLGICEK